MSLLPVPVIVVPDWVPSDSVAPLLAVRVQVPGPLLTRPTVARVAVPRTDTAVSVKLKETGSCVIVKVWFSKPSSEAVTVWVAVVEWLVFFGKVTVTVRLPVPEAGLTLTFSGSLVVRFQVPEVELRMTKVAFV